MDIETFLECAGIVFLAILLAVFILLIGGNLQNHLIRKDEWKCTEISRITGNCINYQYKGQTNEH